MIWMLDTNTCINFMNRRSGYEYVARRMSGRSPAELKLSAITLCELRFGLEKSMRKNDNLLALTQFLTLVEVDDFPASAAAGYAEIKLAIKGRVISDFDLLIAAHARSIRATAVTSNVDEFARVPGLRVADWMLA
ncbi:MAG: type II toxin-antitoxin system VapC family toxin [Burkholderiales bacterium]|nr:type II toxin-antitoxin system VapC family toxin [Burkholderiales bacterium]